MNYFFVLVSLMTSLAFAQYSPVEKLVPLEHVYIPFGFDSNDNTEVIIAGYLPNTCYKAPRAKFHINQGKIEITVSALYYKNEHQPCTQVTIPFVEVASLGPMYQGAYNVVANQGTAFEKRAHLLVSPSVSNTKDVYLYARVQAIEAIQGTRRVILKGYNPSDCFELREIMTISNKTDTYSILPVLKMDEGSICHRKMVAFSYEYEVPVELNLRKVLLHVRSMDGHSVNAIYDNAYNVIDKTY